MTSFVLRQAHVLDERGSFGGPADIRVRDGVIEAVGSDVAADGLVSYDLAGSFVMPGVFDCHTHPAMTVRDHVTALQMPITEWALAAADGLRRTLEGGVTFVRDAGGVDPGLRAGIRKGYATGPSLQLSIVLLSQTGGQMDGYLAGPGLDAAIGYLIPDSPSRPPWLADGVEEVRKATRTILRAGADWIKICAGSGPHAEGQGFDRREYSYEEIEVAVVEAARQGKPVMADVKAPESIGDCVRAGVRSVEHGLFLDEERARMMAERDVWLVPTHYVYRDLLERGANGDQPAWIMDVMRDATERSRDLVRIARAAGVRIALGSDAFGNHMHGNNLRELVFLHEAGMPAEEVLLTATLRGAELCGVDDRYGRIVPGAIFDAIVLDEDPSDLRVFARPDVVRGVFQAGTARVVHERLREGGAGWPASS
jgi:imidazolonepropionase-like amidohydrolase